jgi:hypothetical protein
MGYLAEKFKKELKEPTYEEILEKVRQTESYFWFCWICGILLIFVGVSMIFHSPANNTKALFLGLFLAVLGPIIIAQIKIFIQIKFSMLYIIWLSSKRIEDEIRKSEAADL